MASARPAGPPPPSTSSPPPISKPTCSPTHTHTTPDFLWASPPCDEYAASFMPWNKRFGTTPSTALAEAAIRIRDETSPAFWVIENVKGSAKWLRPLLGEPQVIGAVYLWHNLPRPIDARPTFWKERLSSTKKAERAAMPYPLVRAVVAAVNEAMSSLYWTT